MRELKDGKRELPEIKVLVTDIDATITDDERRISLPAIKAIRELKDHGIKTVLATGNAYPVVLYLAKFIGTGAPVVAENGGVVGWEERGIKEVLGSRSASLELTRKLEKRYGIGYLRSDAWRESEVVIDRSLPYSLISALAKENGLKVEDTKFAYHISEPHVKKIEGVRRGLSLLELELDDALAIGDSQNDEEMLRLCGIGAAVANATPGAKSAADHISREPFGAGFVEIVKWYFPDLRG